MADLRVACTLSTDALKTRREGRRSSNPSRSHASILYSPAEHTPRTAESILSRHLLEPASPIAGGSYATSSPTDMRAVAASRRSRRRVRRLGGSYES